MKLRNKKTGEIIKLRDNEKITIPLEDEDGDWYEEYYSSIDKLNEEWEDYEENQKDKLNALMDLELARKEAIHYIDMDTDTFAVLKGCIEIRRNKL